jgi:hypothetical protein
MTAMMSMRSVPLTKGMNFEFWHDWSSFSPNVNWRDFCFLHLSVEQNSMLGRFETELCVIGLWFRVVYVYNDSTPNLQRLREYLDLTMDDQDDQDEAA